MPKPPAATVGRSARRAKSAPSFRVDAVGGIRLPSGRFAPRAAVELAALRGGFRWADQNGRVRSVAPVRSIALEEGRAKRVRKDRVAVELGASRFQRVESAEGARVNSYVLPEPLPLEAAAAALDAVSQSAAGAELDGFSHAHVVVRLVDEDGQVRYFAASHAIIGSGAVAEAAAKMREWARRYKASRVIGIDVLKLGHEEQRRNEARNEGRRIRAREARDRARGIRTTRGR